ncbi:MAG: response regulator transcription factor [Sandaracinaceae bacterium]
MPDRDAWPTAEALAGLAFDARSRTAFRREVMRWLLRSTGSDMALFADATASVRDSHVINMVPAEAEAARQTVIAHPAELRRANEQLRRRGVLVDTSLYSAREWARLPHVVGHQVAMGITSNLIMGWQPRRGPPVILNLCRGRGRYGEDDELKARQLVRSIAIADAWHTDTGDDGAVPAPELTERQREILLYVQRGLTNREIAGICHLSPFTVRNHLVRLFERFEVSTRTELAMVALEEGEATEPSAFALPRSGD